MNINLREYGTCGFVSGHHASIFLDRVTARFYLLNYSPHGTSVDRVLYGPDLTKAKPTTLDQVPIFLSDIQAIGTGPRGARGLMTSELARDKKWLTENILQKSKSYVFKGEEVIFESEESVETSHEETLLPRTTPEPSVQLQAEYMLPELSSESLASAIIVYESQCIVRIYLRNANPRKIRPLFDPVVQKGCLSHIG